MSLLTLATLLFVELARQFPPRSAPRNSGPQSAKASDTLSDLPNGGTGTPGTNLGTLFNLISLGVVATATAVVFFGISFFLLAHPDVELIAGPSARNGGVEVEPQRADLVPSPNKDATALNAEGASAPAVPPAQPPEAHEDLPPASSDMASGSLPTFATDTGSANATFDASSSQEPRGLRSNADEAALVTPTGVTHAAAHHKMPPRTGSIANQLNHEELARLQTGSSMPPPAPRGGMPPPAPMLNPSGGNSLGFPGRAPGHFVDRR
jgi:hypothetical protein